MRAKVAMANLSHNENCTRHVELNKDGTPSMVLQRMRHGGPRMRVKRMPRTNNWKKLVFQNFILKFKNSIALKKEQKH